jgi:hypothetical protein
VYGNRVPFSGTGGYGSGEVCVRSVAIGQTGKLADIGIITSTSGVSARIGLYADSAGAPGALVVDTGVMTLNGSAQLAPAAGLPSVSSGAYWIAIAFDGTVNVLEDRSVRETAYCATLSFGPLPSTFPSAASYQGSPANLYVLVQ